MPVRNGEDYLEEALESLLEQEFADFELIISDNASTDGTQQICERFAAEDPRVRYERSPRNIGGAPNFNRVFRLSRTPYFKWACHDDLHAPSHLLRCVEALDAAPPDVALVYPRSILISGDGAEQEPYEDEMDLRQPRAWERLRLAIHELKYSNPLFGLIRAEALSKTRLLGSYISADRVLVAELAMLGRFFELPEQLFYRRIHPGMSTKANPTPGLLAAWFSPRPRGGPPMPAARVLVEYARAVAHVPLPRETKARCYAVVAELWLRRSRLLAEELVLALRGALGGGAG
jgi:glycosyltransferase involved in cell wall biosynthesis